jgi:hypothetical protein
MLTPSSFTGSYNIATAAPANNTQGYVGNAFGGMAYFEAKIKFDPTTVNFSQGFPAFWGFSIEHAANMGADHPAGTPAGFQHFIEDDFFEFDISWASSIAYGTAIHDWYGIYSSTCQEGYLKGSPGFCDVTKNGVGTPYNNFVSTKQNNVTIDWTQWHIIGQLWVPGNPYIHPAGYVQNFTLASAVDGRIDRSPEIASDLRGQGEAQALDHQDPDQALLRIGAPRRAEAAIPAETRGDHRRVVPPGQEGHAEAPTAAFPEAGKKLGHRFLRGRDLVGGHGQNRGLREHALVSAPALVQ